MLALSRSSATSAARASATSPWKITKGWDAARPLLAATLTIFLLSLIGIPITGGFFAKFYVFSAALQANLVGLVIIGVLNSAIASYYYLRMIVVMYMREAREDIGLPPIPFGLGTALAISLVATIYLGVLPDECSITPRAPRPSGLAEPLVGLHSTATAISTCAKIRADSSQNANVSPAANKTRNPGSSSG